jgi:geranylgeranyl reductase family protein
MSGSGSIREQYDIAVVGAGPAGLCAARRIVSEQSGASVLMVDKRLPWQEPVACAEGAGRLGLHEVIQPQDAWIRLVISKATFHSPDGTSITYADKNKGYIIDRARMHRDLSDWCIARGADGEFDRRVVDVSPPDDGRGMRTLKFEDGDSVRARVVIDCSGPLSRIGKTEQLCCKAPDLEPAYFAHVENVSLPEDTVQIYVGRQVAPGGYAWAFPRGNGAFNIGVVLGRASGSGQANIRALLDSFLQNHFPGCRVHGKYAGPIPCSGSKKLPMATQGLLKAGDAASTVNPVSRAGIVEAMLSGNLAGQFAVSMLGAESSRAMKSIGRKYENAWQDRLGRRHNKLARVKNALAKVPDVDYNRSASALGAIPRDQLTMSRIFAVSLGRFPRLVWAMRHLM